MVAVIGAKGWTDKALIFNDSFPYLFFLFGDYVESRSGRGGCVKKIVKMGMFIEKMVGCPVLLTHLEYVCFSIHGLPKLTGYPTSGINIRRE